MIILFSLPQSLGGAKIMFELTKHPLNTPALNEKLKDETTGAIVSFEGLVRNHNEGKIVKALEYEAYESLVYSEMAKIFTEVKQRFPSLTNSLCLHRLGKLQIKECAVWVGVSASHRKEAFEACKYIIDELKKRATIWKKEYYQNGSAEWVSCHNCPLD